MATYITGIDLGGTKICTAVAYIDKRILSRVKIPTEAQKGPRIVWQNIFDSIETAALRAGISPEEISRIGIGVPGPVDYRRSLVRVCPNIPGWTNVPVKKILQSRFPWAEIILENDARAAGLAEARRGAARGHWHVFYVTVGTGIGGALIQGGQLYQGASGSAGEIGHIWLGDGISLEDMAAGPAIQRLFAIDPVKIREALKHGEAGAQKALDHLVHYLGLGLANVATLLNPEIIVIGGGVANLGIILLAPLRAEVRKLGFSISGRQVKIKKACLGDNAGLIGILEICAQEV